MIFKVNDELKLVSYERFTKICHDHKLCDSIIADAYRILVNALEENNFVSSVSADGAIVITGLWGVWCPDLFELKNNQLELDFDN